MCYTYVHLSRNHSDFKRKPKLLPFVLFNNLTKAQENTARIVKNAFAITVGYQLYANINLIFFNVATIQTTKAKLSF